MKFWPAKDLTTLTDAELKAKDQQLETKIISNGVVAGIMLAVAPFALMVGPLALMACVAVAGAAACRVIPFTSQRQEIKKEIQQRTGDYNIVAVSDGGGQILSPSQNLAPDFNEKATTLDKDIKGMRPLRIAAKIHSFGQG